jgi:hypothetical protein
MHYRGTLEDGTEFDASYNRGSVSYPQRMTPISKLQCLQFA